MSLHIAKLFKNPLALAGAALIIHISSAAAADAASDAQQQARELLTGTHATHSDSQPRPRDVTATSPALDAQELARELLLGTTGSRVTRAQTITLTENSGPSVKTAPQARAYSDAQAAARALLLGQHETSEASYLAARPAR